MSVRSRGTVRGRTPLVAFAVALACAACAPGHFVTHPSAPPAPAITGVTEKGPVTLTVWDQESGPVSKVWDRLNAEFEQKYPNVTIKRVNRDFGELKTLLKLAISSPHAPDVVEANQGWPDMGQLVKAGLLLPLDNYAKAYGWDKRVSDNVRAISSWSPDGTEFGTGNLYGYTSMGEIVGVYYNKTMLAELGLAIPTTFGEFEHDLAVAKQAGEMPIQFGNNDAFPGIHEYAVIQDQMASAQLPDRASSSGARGTGCPSTPRRTCRRRPSCRTGRRSGYFTPGFGGGGYDTAVANFAEGPGAVHDHRATGSWRTSGPTTGTSGSSCCRRMTAGATARSRRAARASRWRSPSASKHPDVAAAYIDWMTNDHASRAAAAGGRDPAARPGPRTLVRRSRARCWPTS